MEEFEQKNTKKIDTEQAKCSDESDKEKLREKIEGNGRFWPHSTGSFVNFEEKARKDLGVVCLNSKLQWQPAGLKASTNK